MKTSISISPMLFKKEQRSRDDDATLIESFLSGNREAQKSLHDLVERLTDRALQTLELKGSCFHDRQNTKQEIIVSVLIENDSAVLRTFNGQSRLSTYLWSVIRFKLIDKLRKDMLSTRRLQPINNNLSHEVEYTAKELYDLIDQFLDGSSEKEAFVLRMRWLEGRSYAAICRMANEQGINITPTYIGNLLFKKRIHLLRFLKKHGYDFDKQVKHHHNNPVSAETNHKNAYKE